MKETPQIVLVYDRECPVCAAYCKALAIRQLDQNMQILNAREDHPEVREIKRRGLDLDEGFVLRIGTEYHHGAEAIHRLALLSTPSGVFNRVNYFIFRSQALSRLLYPAMRLGRNLILAVLGRQRIKTTESIQG
jgi:predicted DCC family thiol-disulfide oxidoreductase YuxK